MGYVGDLCIDSRHTHEIEEAPDSKHPKEKPIGRNEETSNKEGDPQQIPAMKAYAPLIFRERRSPSTPERRFSKDTRDEGNDSPRTMLFEDASEYGSRGSAQRESGMENRENSSPIFLEEKIRDEGGADNKATRFSQTDQKTRKVQDHLGLGETTQDGCPAQDQNTDREDEGPSIPVCKKTDKRSGENISECE
jgi:hypothetical protein